MLELKLSSTQFCISERNTNISHQFLTINNFCEFTTQEHKFKRCAQKPILNFRIKDFWYTKINLSQKYILYTSFLL